jgi:hypothetical protein
MKQIHILNSQSNDYRPIRDELENGLNSKNNCCHSVQTILSFRAVISNLTIKYVDRKISNKTIRCGDIIKLDATIRKTVIENAD